MGVIKKIKTDISLLWNTLFFGLKSADNLLSQKDSSANGETEINIGVEKDSVLQDFVRGEETQRVKETRDEMYRVLKESENLTVTRTDVEGGTSLKVRKKTAADFAIKIDVFNPEKLPIRLVQDNKFYEEGNSFSIEDLETALTKKYISIFTIKRDFIPRFKIEDYAKKLVVRNINNKEVFLDFYTSEYASQFGKIDALFVKQIYDIKQTNNKKSDITTFDTIQFITDKATGENSLCQFEYNNIVFKEVNVFDGNFVITFKAKVVVDGEYIGKKYETKELNKKLENKQKRDSVNAVDAETLLRHIKQVENNETPDYGSVIFKLDKE